MNKKQIIFLEAWPEVMIYKIAKLFKEKGYNTISIRLLKSKGLSNDFYKQAFDEIISFNLDFFKINIKNTHLILFSLIRNLKNFFKATKSVLKLKPYVIFGRAVPNWPIALTKIIFKKYPLIYFPYDIRAQPFASREDALKHGTKSFEISAEKFCFENAEGIMHKGALDELEYLKNKKGIGDHLKINPLQINFHPYCSDEFIVPLNKNKLSKKDKEIHLVYIASAGSVDPKKSPLVFDYAKVIVKQKLHIHLYIRPNTLSKEEVADSYTKAYKELSDSKYFHVHSALEPKELIKEISKYDFGLWFIDYSSKSQTYHQSVKLGTGNKLASYLEAGIPFFYPLEHQVIDKIMKKCDLRLHINDLNHAKNLGKTIRKLNYKNLEKNVLKAREDFNMKNNFQRLEKFVKKVVKTKKSR